MPCRKHLALARGLALLAGAALAGCTDTTNLAPASPEAAWPIPASLSPSASQVQPIATAQPAMVDQGHTYSLLELIDIAERRNQTTRIAWEQARQAAIAVGVAQAAYLPAITASAIGGYQHVALPFPKNFAARGYITADSEEIFPQLAINYLLFDFGTRQAAVGAATQLSIAANVSFTQAHQKLILDVSRAYFELDGASAQLRAAEQGLHDADELQRSAEALSAHGMGTSVAVDIARREVAQRRFDVVGARTMQHDAKYGLLAAMDLPPTTPLRVADVSTRPLPDLHSRTLETALDDALRRRPEVIAAVVRLRASDQQVALAASAFRPKLTIEANVQENIGQISVDGQGYLGVRQPQAGMLLRFAWPLYQGGLLQNRLRAAQSQHDEAVDALQEVRNQTLREVAMAYDQLQTGLQQYAAALALLHAAQTAYDSATNSYAHGVATYTDATQAEGALAAARGAVTRTHAQALVNAAALSFATGALTSAEAATAPL